MVHQDRSCGPEECAGRTQIRKSFDRLQLIQSHSIHFVLERQLPRVQLQYLQWRTLVLHYHCCSLIVYYVRNDNQTIKLF